MNLPNRKKKISKILQGTIRWENRGNSDKQKQHNEHLYTLKTHAQ